MNLQTITALELPVKSLKLEFSKKLVSQMDLTFQSKQSMDALFASYPQRRFECNNLFDPSSPIPQEFKRTIFEICFWQLDRMS